MSKKEKKEYPWYERLAVIVLAIIGTIIIYPFKSKDF